MKWLVLSVAVNVLLITVLVVIGRRLARNRQRLESMRRRRSAIVGEEKRLFSFLNKLGETLRSGASTAEMHRVMVEGACEVLEAKEGALYLLDAEGQKLHPGWLSRGCPPLFPVREADTMTDSSAPRSLMSYLRLRSVPAGEGLLSECLARRLPMHVENIFRHPSWEGSFDVVFGRSEAEAILAPMIHGDRPLGVLTVLIPRTKSAFTRNDLDVFSSLSDQCAQTLANAMIHREASQKRQLDRELRLASEVQRVLLPRQFPEISDYQLAAVNHPARVVSGDYYDFLRVDENHWGVAIADVSGKGVPASLLMAMARSVLRSNSQGNRSPAAVLRTVNRALFPDIREDMFVTMAYLIIDSTSQRLTFARAGHDPPLAFRSRTGEVETMEAPGIALGLDAGPAFDRVTRDREFTLEPGDSVLLFTDGVTEAMNRDEDEFGIDTLKKVFARSAAGGAAAAVGAVEQAVAKFTQGRIQSDDITLVAIAKRGDPDI